MVFLAFSERVRCSVIVRNQANCYRDLENNALQPYVGPRMTKAETKPRVIEMWDLASWKPFVEPSATKAGTNPIAEEIWELTHCNPMWNQG